MTSFVLLLKHLHHFLKSSVPWHVFFLNKQLLSVIPADYVLFLMPCTIERNPLLISLKILICKHFSLSSPPHLFLWGQISFQKLMNKYWECWYLGGRARGGRGQGRKVKLSADSLLIVVHGNTKAGRQLSDISCSVRSYSWRTTGRKWGLSAGALGVWGMCKYLTVLYAAHCRPARVHSPFVFLCHMCFCFFEKVQSLLYPSPACSKLECLAFMFIHYCICHVKFLLP